MPKRNMYGCLPCPKCGSVYRAGYEERPTKGKPRQIECDDCGFAEPWDEGLVRIMLGEDDDLEEQP